MKKHSIAFVATISALAITLGACSSSDSGSTSSANGGDVSTDANAPFEVKLTGDYNPKERDEIQDGGTLVYPIGELTEQMNYHHANGTTDTGTVWRWYNPQPMLYDGSGEWSINPNYITDYSEETVDDKTVVTFDLNEEAKFNDGTPIDWKVYENTWRTNNGQDPEFVVNSSDGYDLIETVARGDNDFQVVITFETAYPWWKGLFNTLLHPAVNTAELFNEAYIKDLHPEWGAGPFKVDTVDFNAGTVSFVRNELWWGDEGKLDKVTLRQMESQAIINAFQAGEIDMAGAGSKDNLAVVEGMDGVDIRAALTPANYLLVLNGRGPILSDIEVRKAIFTGIDRAQIAAIRFNGLHYTEDLPGSFTLYQTQEGYEDNFGAVVQYDQDKAKEILEDAGWTEGTDGIREKDGQRLEINYTLVGESNMVKSTAQATQKMLKDIGIQMNVQERPSSEFSKILKDRDFDIFSMGFRSTDPFGVAYFKQTWASDSELNVSATGTTEFDAKIEELQRIADADEQTKRANELEKEAFQFYGIMPYANGPTITAVKKGLANAGAMGFADLPKENVGWEK